MAKASFMIIDEVSDFPLIILHKLVAALQNNDKVKEVVLVVDEPKPEPFLYELIKPPVVPPEPILYRQRDYPYLEARVAKSCYSQKKIKVDLQKLSC